MSGAPAIASKAVGQRRTMGRAVRAAWVALVLLSAGLALPFGSARAQTTDAVAPNVRANMALPYVYNGSTFDRQRTPFVFKNLSAVVVTSETTIWTPAASKKFRLMGFCLAQGVATGAVTLKDNTAGTTIMIVPQETTGVAFCSPPLGNGILSAAANNVLTATGVSTETLTGFVFGTEE